MVRGHIWYTFVNVILDVFNVLMIIMRDLGSEIKLLHSHKFKKFFPIQMQLYMDMGFIFGLFRIYMFINQIFLKLTI